MITANEARDIMKHAEDSFELVDVSKFSKRMERKIIASARRGESNLIYNFIPSLLVTRQLNRMRSMKKILVERGYYVTINPTYMYISWLV